MENKKKNNKISINDKLASFANAMVEIEDNQVNEIADLGNDFEDNIASTKIPTRADEAPAISGYQAIHNAKKQTLSN